MLLEQNLCASNPSPSQQWSPSPLQHSCIRQTPLSGSARLGASREAGTAAEEAVVTAAAVSARPEAAVSAKPAVVASVRPAVAVSVSLAVAVSVRPEAAASVRPVHVVLSHAATGVGVVRLGTSPR